MRRIVCQLFLSFMLGACLRADDTVGRTAQPGAVPAEALVEEALPVSPVNGIPSFILDAHRKSVHRWQITAGCKVAPLLEITDPEALLFEQNAEAAPADVSGLTAETSMALTTMEQLVTAAGGTLALRSAYRPVTYQAHLNDVWVKWMRGLRNNKTAGCRALREEVGAEFARHQLLAKQQPAPASDHALGLAFDAAVSMPRAPRLHGKRITVDKLAMLAGIKRPNSRRDPVHFKLIAEPPVAFIRPVRETPVRSLN